MDTQAHARRASATRAGTALGAVAIVLWSSSVAFGRSLAAACGPLRAAAAVYALCAVLAVAYLVARPARLQQVVRLPRRYLLGCGALFVGYVVCFYLALGLAADSRQAIEVGTVNYLWPAATVVLSRPLLGTRTRWTLVPGALLAVGGIAVATLPLATWHGAGLDDSLRKNWLPYLLALVAALDWAVYSNLSRRWAGGAGASAVPAFMVVTGCVMGALAVLWPSPPAAWTLGRTLELAYLAVVPTSLGYACWEIAARRGNFVLVATMSYFTPLLSAAIAAVHLRTLPGPGLWIGCVLVIAGGWVCNASVRRDAG